MQSPLFLGNEDIEEIGNIQVMDEAVNIPTISNVDNSKSTQLIVKDIDDESEIAILEERTRQLLIELQQKRNDESTKDATSKVVEGWIEREENAKLRAETAENRAQCVMVAAAKLAEENDTLNRKFLESAATYKALKNENNLLTSQVRSLLVKVAAHEQKMNEVLAEKASADANKKILGDKMNTLKETMDKVNRWIAESEESHKSLREEIEALKPLKSKAAELIIQNKAQMEYLRQKLNESTKTIAQLTAENGALKARSEITKK